MTKKTEITKERVEVLEAILMMSDIALDLVAKRIINDMNDRGQEPERKLSLAMAVLKTLQNEYMETYKPVSEDITPILDGAKGRMNERIKEEMALYSPDEIEQQIRNYPKWIE